MRRRRGVSWRSARCGGARRKRDRRGPHRGDRRTSAPGRRAGAPRRARRRGRMRCALDARMGPAPRALDQPRGRRVQRDGARRRHQVVLVHRRRAEPPLKQMVWRARALTKPAQSRRPRESASASPSPSSAARIRWTGIGRQAIGPAGDAEAPAGGSPFSAKRGRRRVAADGVRKAGMDRCRFAVTVVQSDLARSSGPHAGRDAAGRGHRKEALFLLPFANCRISARLRR